MDKDDDVDTDEMEMEAPEDVEEDEPAVQLEEEEEEEGSSTVPINVTRPKLKRTSIVPTPATKRGVSMVNLATATRLQKSKIVREAISMYPTEIDYAVKNLYASPPSLEGLSEPFKGFMNILRTYMGHDPNSLDFNVIEDRILRSTKADDESDSEHFQRIASALQILNTIKNSRVDTLKDIVGLSQKEINDDRQHDRYLQAISVKRDKADSEIMKDKIATETAEFDLEIKKSRERELGSLLRKIEAEQTRAKLANLSAFPDRPLYDFYTSQSDAPTTFYKRMMYVSVNM